MALCVGDVVGGRYALEHLIGSGGMGDVFRGRDRVLTRAVAVKLVYTGDPRKRQQATRAFLREARISAAISHPHVVQILDFGVHDDTVPFMVLELLEGEPLAAVLSRGEAMTFEWISQLAIQVLDGLSAAHDAGVVHRDLKPENIFLSRGRDAITAKILDFGISRVLEDGQDPLSTSNTTTGKVLGTPAYMSPEQARAKGSIDKRTDIYSMGVVLYELISGSMPFYADSAFDLLTKIVSEDPIPLDQLIPDVDRTLAAIVTKAMRRNPDERFRDAAEMRRALADACSSFAAGSAPRKLSERPRPPSWRKDHGKPDPRRDLETLPSDTMLARNVETELFRPVAPRARRSGTRALLITAVLAGVSGIATAAVLLGRSNAEPAQHFIVVRADDRAQPDKAADPPIPVPEGDEQVVQEKTPPDRPARPREGGAVDALTKTFRKQKQGIVRCVNEHASEAEGTDGLGVRLQLDADGRVLSAHPSPHTLEGKPLGACIAAAAQEMQFPAPGEPVSLHVPLATKPGAKH